MKSIKLLILFTVLYACGQKAKIEQRQPQKSVPVKVTSVKHKKMVMPISSQGKLSSSQESHLSFKIGGIIQNVLVNEGQEVRKGQLLARLNQSEIKAKYRQAEVSFDKAQRDYKRMQRLYDDEVVTLETLQNAETVYEVAQSDLEIAKFNIKHATISAPTNGQVLHKFVDENELVDPGAPVFAFGNTQDAWIIKTGLIDRDLVNINVGDSAKVIFDALPEETFDARVSLIPNAPNPENGTYEIELRLIDAPAILKNGFYAKVEIYPSRKREYRLIPMTSLVEGDGRAGYVYVPDGKNVNKQKVYISDFLGDQLVVSSGLEKVTAVVVEGALELTESSSIQIVN